MPKLSEGLLIEGLQKEAEALVKQMRHLEGALTDVWAEPASLTSESITHMQALDHAIQRAEDMVSLLNALQTRLQWTPGRELSVTELYDVLKLKGGSFGNQDGPAAYDTALEMFEDDNAVNWF